MLKNIFAMLMGLSFAATANAAYEVQISQSISGTGANITMTDDGDDSTTSYGFQGEVYFGFSEQMQIGGILGYADSGVDGADAQMNLGVGVRYNLSTELRDAMFVGAAIVYSDFGGDANNIGLGLQVGKRYALSDTITWTPNVTFGLPISGDDGAGNDPEGYTLTLNLISFSGFME